MRKILSFSHHDYYLPLSIQISQIKSLKTAEEILKYSPIAIRAAKPVLDLSNSTPANKKIFSILTASLPTSKPNQLLTNPENSFNEHKFVTENLQTDLFQVPTNISAICSFEELWVYLQHKKESFTEKEIISLHEQSYKIILTNSVDLHHLSLVYEYLCHRVESLEVLWELFDGLVKNYFYSFVPEELLRVTKGFFFISNKVIHRNSWVYYIEHLNQVYFDEFSTEELCEFIRIAERLKISVLPSVINRAKSEVGDDLTINSLYVLNKYKNYNFETNSFNSLLSNPDSSSKINLIQVCIDLKAEDRIFSAVIDSIFSQATKISTSDLLTICELLFSARKFPNQCFEIILKLEPQLSSFSFNELIRLIDFLIKQRISTPISKSFLETLGERILKLFRCINSENFSSVVQFFSCLFPYEPVHSALCEMIVQAEKNDLRMGSKPNHQFFEVYENGECLVFNNDLLANVNFVKVVTVICGLNSNFAVSEEVRRILKKYLKVIIIKSYFKLDLKHRSSIAAVLANAEMFDKELVGLFMEKLKFNLIFNNKPVKFVQFSDAVKKLAALGVSDPIIKEFL